MKAKHRLASGELRDVDIYMTFLEVEGRKMVLVMNFDIADKIAMEEVLNHQRQDYEMVFNTTPTMIVIRDQDGKIIRANKAYADRMGMAADEMIGVPMSDLMPEGWKEAHADDLEIIRTGRPLRSVERTYLARDGEKRWGQVVWVR
jgi:PAS domain S-box-containing protein